MNGTTKHTLKLKCQVDEPIMMEMEMSNPIKPVKTVEATNPMAALLQNQMASFVAKMTAAGTLSSDGQVAAMAQVTEMMSTITIPVAAPRTRTKRVVDDEVRCMARVWGSGAGTQCSYQRKSGEYCNRCHKKSLVTTEPCQYNAEGKHIGLFWGRVDEERPFMSEGAIAVQWKDAESVAKVAAALASGIKHRVGPNSTNKGPRKPRAAKKTKGKKLRPKRVKNAFFHFLGEVRAQKKAELIAAAAEGEKVGVSDVTKALGAVWKTMDTEARAPYTVLEAAGKAVALAEFEALMANMDTDVELVPVLVDQLSSSLATIEVPINGLGNDEIGDILAQGLNDLGEDMVEEEDQDDVEAKQAKVDEEM